MSVQYLEIEDHQDVGQRLDNFLMRFLKGVPRAHVYKILRSGEVRVNGGRVKANYRIQLADRIRIPPVRARQEVPVSVTKQDSQWLLDRVLYEDKDYMVINKPIGLAVHGGSNVSAGVIEILRSALQNSRLELVHRLDRDTSGCLALAKNRPALVIAQQSFRDRTVKKIYELIVLGQWPKKNASVHLKLQRYNTAWGERRVRVDTAGRSARTDFAVLATAKQATRLQATLHTGRTHQIRVHTSALGHCIVGDTKYSRGSQREEAVNSRLCLHAKKLRIPLEDGHQIRVEAALDDNFEQIWQNYADIHPGKKTVKTTL